MKRHTAVTISLGVSFAFVALIDLDCEKRGLFLTSRAQERRNGSELTDAVLRRLRMRLSAIEYLTDCLTFVGCKCRKEDEGASSFVDARAYHSTRIGVRNKHQRPTGPLQRAFELGYVI